MIMAVKAKWIVAALLSLTLFGCGGTQQAEPPKSELAPAPATPAPGDTRPVIVAFGDSLTAGYGVEPGKSYREVRADFEADFERRYVSWLLDRHAGNISAAAREAKMDRKHLYDLARKHGLRGERG